MFTLGINFCLLKHTDCIKVPTWLKQLNQLTRKKKYFHRVIEANLLKHTDWIKREAKNMLILPHALRYIFIFGEIHVILIFGKIHE
jgi:hypothetical protein